MSKVWYGNLTNRLEEGKNYTGREIRVGDDITMYLWSDRRCYYVTEVIDQKHIKVREYIVMHDKSKEWYMGNQDWVYFKTAEEAKKYHPTYENHRDEEETWVFRYGKWMTEFVFTENNYCTKRELESLNKKGYYKRYFDLSGKLSFGVRDYHYDWEF